MILAAFEEKALEEGIQEGIQEGKQITLNQHIEKLAKYFLEENSELSKEEALKKARDILK